jgi:hypothetical protein
MTDVLPALVVNTTRSSSRLCVTVRRTSHTPTVEGLASACGHTPAVRVNVTGSVHWHGGTGTKVPEDYLSCPQTATCVNGLHDRAPITFGWWGAPALGRVPAQPVGGDGEQGHAARIFPDGPTSEPRSTPSWP